MKPLPHSALLPMSSNAPCGTPPRDGRRIAAGLACCALLGSLAAVGCGGAGSAAPPAGGAGAGGAGKAPAGPPPPLVRVARLTLEEVAPEIAVVGSIVPRHSSVVASGASGLVEQFLVDEGQYVEQQDVLSILRMKSTDLEIEVARATEREREEAWKLSQQPRSEDVAEAQARLLAAEALRDNTRIKLRRTRELLAQTATNRGDLEDAEERNRAAEHAFEALSQAFKRIEAGLRPEEKAQAKAKYEAQAAEVARLEEEKSKRTTKAPFAGWVSKKHSYVGQWLAHGDPVVTLDWLDEVDVIANVDQQDLRHVRLGSVVPVRVRGTVQPQWAGTVVSIVPRSDWESGSRSFPVRVRARNEIVGVGPARQPVLRAGMMAEVRFAGTPEKSLMVSKDCLVRGTRGTFVYAFLPDDSAAASGRAVPSAGSTGSYQQVLVETGLTKEGRVQLVGQGLADGAWIIVEGAERLRGAPKCQIAADAPAATTGLVSGAPKPSAPSQEAASGSPSHGGTPSRDGATPNGAAPSGAAGPQTSSPDRAAPIKPGDGAASDASPFRRPRPLDSVPPVDAPDVPSQKSAPTGEAAPSPPPDRGSPPPPKS